MASAPPITDGPSKIPGMAAAAYGRMTTDRQPYLDNARDCAELTVPSLFRHEGDHTAKIIVPWNSIGAYCINNLSAKLIFAFFPAGRPNFKASQDKRAELAMASLEEDERISLKQVIDEGLSRMEQDVAEAIEEDGDRARMFVAAMRLLIGGNHGFQQYPDGTIRGIPLERYVTKRDPQGNLIAFAIKDSLDWETIDEDVREAIVDKGTQPEPLTEGGNELRPVDVFTYGRWRDNRWHVFQEACAVEVTESNRTYTKDALPYLFVPWILLDGEHYGRSYCEFFQGDLQAAEGFTKTIGEGAAALARFLILVNPVGLTNRKAIAEADNGAVIPGRVEDVHSLTSEKSADFSIAQSTLDAALGRLGRAFLLQSSVQRKGERVTAEEVREVSSELEDGLGGVYSQQIVSWQRPYVLLKIAALQRAGRVAKLPKGTVKITVTAGLAALGRNAELASLRQLAALMMEMFGAEAALQYLKADGFLKKLCAALGVDPEGLVKSDKELAADAQQAQQQQLISTLGPEALKQFGANATGRQVADINAQAKMGQAAPPTDQSQTPQEQ